MNATPSRSVIVFRALVVLLASAFVAYFVYSSATKEESRFPFVFGLDLAGGSRLVYQADISRVRPEEVPDALEVLRDVIERRANVFGVSEPLVQIEESSVVAESREHRLVVELPGVTDVNEAVRQIGQTPSLDFRLIEETTPEISLEGETQTPEIAYIETGLTGRFLERASLEFGSTQQGSFANESIVQLKFNEDGARLFEEITRDNVGKQLAIFLDGVPVSAPVIREAISGGTATISGNFTPTEARELVRNLNFGALPVPIALASTQTIGASLGDEAVKAAARAGVYGFAILSLFMIAWYRLPGVVAVVSLCIYVAIMLALFQVVPVVLTAAGLAGFILSIGLAVDANILIAERIKEELREGKATDEAITEGFSRAWLAIRDSNLTHVIASVILFWFGTALIKGFALVFAFGVIVSMFSAITVSRTLLRAVAVRSDTWYGRLLLQSGFTR